MARDDKQKARCPIHRALSVPIAVLEHGVGDGRLIRPDQKSGQSWLVRGAKTERQGEQSRGSRRPDRSPWRPRWEGRVGIPQDLIHAECAYGCPPGAFAAAGFPMCDDAAAPGLPTRKGRMGWR